MKNYMAFLGKEFLEYRRTYKVFIMVIVFSIIGIISPLMAKMLPDILNNLLTQGMTITLPKPTALDAWNQFFKNTTQMGLIVLVVVFSGILSSERSKGTLINMLTKGLSRTTVILSKYSAMAILWTLSLLVSVLLTLGYSSYLFPNDTVPNLVPSILYIWLFGLFLLGLLLLAGTLTKTNYSALLFTGAIVASTIFISIIPTTHDYNPLTLASANTGLMTNSLTPPILKSCHYNYSNLNNSINR